MGFADFLADGNDDTFIARAVLEANALLKIDTLAKELNANTRPLSIAEESFSLKPFVGQWMFGGEFRERMRRCFLLFEQEGATCEWQPLFAQYESPICRRCVANVHALTKGPERRGIVSKIEQSVDWIGHIGCQNIGTRRYRISKQSS
jgi:hypothetical protein